MPTELNWQPIATAPRDEMVLIFSRRWGAMMATYRSDFKTWFSRMQCPAVLDDDDVALITHWMPLPATPDLPERPASSPATLPPSLSRLVKRATKREAA